MKTHKWHIGLNVETPLHLLHFHYEVRSPIMWDAKFKALRKFMREQQGLHVIAIEFVNCSLDD